MNSLDWERLMSSLMVISGLVALSGLAVAMILTMIGAPQ